MKTLTVAVQNLITQRGIEPVNILEIQWAENGLWYQYADKDVEGTIEGIIISVSSLESIIKIDGQGISQRLDVILDDTNGALKNIINYNDPHGRPVRFYQWFETLPVSEKIKLYEGEISSPIEWNEGDRSLSFSVITKLADKEVGFSPEEGYFPFLSPDLVGVPWPLVFGIVQNVPAVRLNDIPLTQTAEDFNQVDPTISIRINDLNARKIELQDMLDLYILALLQAEFTADFGDTQEQREAAARIADQIEGYIDQINSTLVRLQNEVDQLWETYWDQVARVKESLEVLDAENFPEGKEIVLTLGDTELTGIFSGNTFTINNTRLLNYNGYEAEPFGFTFIEAGSTITIKSDQPILYIANILPTTVQSVQAYRQLENGQQLVTVPSNWYTVASADIGAYTVTYIKFSKPLSSFDETFENDIYITQESSIGPNTVDIIEWMINKYTDFSVDPASFTDVRTKIDNYPSHFAILDRRNIFDVLEDIAFQARCSIWINNNVVYIKYLSEEQDSDKTLTESDIESGSMIIKATETEEVVTKLIATWTDNYALEEKNKIILRHNVKKYGTREREIDFWIYNIGSLVMKSATFWLIRLANIWKTVSFNTFVYNLDIETYDTLTLDFAQNYVADVDIKVSVTNVSYNTNDGMLSLTCWVPVRFGEMQAYDFSWPSQIVASTEFPTNSDITLEYAGGAGPGVDTESGFELTNEDKERSGFINYDFYEENRVRYQRSDYGDRYPSDLDDTKPTPRFKGTAFTAGQKPEYDYDYGNYDVNFGALDELPDDFQGAVFPGKIVSKAEDTVYNVDVYVSGLSKQPTRLKVQQLDILEIDEIPADTWTLVVKNNHPDGEDAGLNEDGFEWTMQVPIWL